MQSSPTLSTAPASSDEIPTGWHSVIMMDFFNTQRPRIFGHRGYTREGATENTALAFLHAIANGATHLETDVCVTRDGVAVISHDLDLTRLTGNKIAVNQLSVAELQKVLLPGNSSFMTLEELLDTFPETPVNLDIKSDAAVIPTVATIRKLRAEARVLVTSFSRRRRLAAARGTNIATSTSTVDVMAILAANASHSPAALRRALAGISAIQMPARMRGVPLISKGLIRRAHAAGVEVHVWVVNDPDEMAWSLELGVDGIVTDRMDVARTVVGDFLKKR